MTEDDQDPRTHPASNMQKGSEDLPMRRLPT